MSVRTIVIVTIGQPSTNPRMVKEYAALKQAGYRVKVLYAYWADWALATDKALLAEKPFDPGDFILAGGSPGMQKGVYQFSRLYFKCAQLFTLKTSLSFFWKWALNRPSFFLAKKAKKEKADLYIAHNLAALPAAMAAAVKWHALCAFDAEDYHLGQTEATAGREYQLVKRLEETYMPGCAYISAASPLIARAYADRLAINDILVVNNVFSVKNLQPEPSPYRRGETLKLFWFSQSVGPDRGLETVITAMGRLQAGDVMCSILGSCSEMERQRLLSLAISSGVQERQLNFIDPVPPDEIFMLAASHHIGLAMETNRILNRQIALTNKLFTYPLSGLAIIATDTPGQRDFLQRYPGIGQLYADGDITALTSLLETYIADPGTLNHIRLQAWNYAKTTLNWEQEQIGLLDRIAAVMRKAV
jgi:glycosyltransferase involved in cell wall biosynthesis